jgi:hypothetical protein
MNTAAPRNSDRPVRATWQSVMSQDVVSTAKVIVDATSSTPVASFRNPGTRGGSGNPESKHSCSLPTEDTRVGPVMWHAISPTPVAFDSFPCSSRRSTSWRPESPTHRARPPPSMAFFYTRKRTTSKASCEAWCTCPLVHIDVCSDTSTPR